MAAKDKPKISFVVKKTVGRAEAREITTLDLFVRKDRESATNARKKH